MYAKHVKPKFQKSLFLSSLLFLPGYPPMDPVVEGSCSSCGARDAAASTILTYFLRQSASHLQPARCCLSFSSPPPSRLPDLLPEHWSTLGRFEPEEWSQARAGHHPHHRSSPVNCLLSYVLRFMIYTFLRVTVYALHLYYASCILM